MRYGKNKKPIFWSPSRYEIANLCLEKYHFKYVLNLDYLLTPEMALGTFMHRRKQKLFKGEPGKLKLAYKSAESFASQSVGMWKLFVARTNKIQGKNIQWRHEKQKFIMTNDVWELCVNTYNRCANEEPPLYVELPVRFKIDRLHFDVRIDEIRKNYTIRDFKTGLSLPEELQLKHFPQFTFYALAFCCKAHKDKEFAEICGISEDERRNFGGNPVYISDKLNLEYYNVKRDLILPTTHRNNQDYFELKHSLKTLEEIIGNLDSYLFPYWGRHCKYCQYKVPCDKKTSSGDFYGMNFSPQLTLFPTREQTRSKNKTLSLFSKRKY